MSSKLTPELIKYKEEFDYLNEKIGELVWERATIFYGKIAVAQSDLVALSEQIENYSANFEILLSKIEKEVTTANRANKMLRIKPIRKE